MSKKSIHGAEARDALKRGVDILANSVKVTLGPKGRHVVIERDHDEPHITKDGVTVAKDIYLDDPDENMGAQMVKSVAAKTAEIAGDGTTTATVLAQAIVTAGLKNVAAGANPMALKRGIDIAVNAVVADLKKQSVAVKGDFDKIAQVGRISANDDEHIGDLISEAMSKVGEHGIITVQEGKGMETTVEVVEGFQFDRGFISQYFITDESKMEAVLENVLILLVDRKLSTMKELLPLLEKVVQEAKSLLIICDDADHDALQGLVVNKMKGNLKVVVVKPIGVNSLKKDFLEDIAVATGGQLFAEEKGIKLTEATPDMLGLATKVIVNKLTTTIINGQGDKKEIEERIAQLKLQLDEPKFSDLDKKHFTARLAKLTGGVAVLNVGAATEIEMKEKLDRIDDAIHATKAAAEEGIVPGGGVAYVRAAVRLQGTIAGKNDDENTGIAIILRAIEEPLRQICENAAVEGSVIIEKVKKGKGAFGYNAREDRYEDLIKAGVIDPTKVARVALEHAASIASLMLTTECLITTKYPEENTK